MHNAYVDKGLYRPCLFGKNTFKGTFVCFRLSNNFIKDYYFLDKEVNYFFNSTIGIIYSNLIWVFILLFFLTFNYLFVKVEIAVRDVYYRSSSNKLCQLLNIHLKSDPLTNNPNSSDTQIYVKDEEPSDRYFI